MLKPTLKISNSITTVSLLIVLFCCPENLKSQEIKTTDHRSQNPMAGARIDLNTGEYNPALMLQEKAKIQHMNQRGALNLNFVNKGPDNIGGRSRAILELYQNPDKLLAGSVSGGLFVSEDGGDTWAPHLQYQSLPNSSSMISSIHEDTVNGVIYVGTGSSFDNSFSNLPGNGIYKSTDGGETFTHITSTTPDPISSGRWTAVNRIKTNKAGHIYAATESSMMMSSDGGQSWTNELYLGPNLQASTCADVAVNENGVVLASLENGRVYISNDGTSGSFNIIDPSAYQNRTNISRTCVAISPQDPQTMYVMFVTSFADGCFNSIFQSTNSGVSWEMILESHPGFDPMSSGNSCTGGYSSTLHVSSNDPNNIYIGGVSLWKFDGNLTQIGTGISGPTPQSNSVHPYQHYILSSPTNPSTLYVTTDGGLFKSTDDGNTWENINKGFITSQFYSLAIAAGDNVIMGGGQSIGTILVNGNKLNNPLIGSQITDGSGFDCSISQYTDIFFSSSQNGNVFRGEINRPVVNLTSGNQSGDFYTNLRLWENKNDPTSRDSIIYTVAPHVQSIATSNGIIKNYNETINPIQPNGIAIKESLSVKAGIQVLTLASDLTTLQGDGEGSVTWKNDGSFEIEVEFTTAPLENTSIDVEYEFRLEANSVLYVESQNMKSNSTTLLIEHRLETDLNPGDQIKVQDPAQSLLTTDAFGGLSVYRNVLNSLNLPVGEQIDIPGISGVQEIQFTKDGNTMFVGTGSGSVYRVTGLNTLYTSQDLENIEVSRILNFYSMVYGIAIDPNDDNRIIVTGVGFGQQNRVRYSSNAMSSNPTFTNVHGNLPMIPVYSAVIDVNNPNLVVIGTEYGVFATSDITQGEGTAWSSERTGTGFVPVYDIVQQQLPWHEAKNSGKLYLATFGRGLFVSEDLVGIEDAASSTTSNEISGLTIFPNPISNEGNIKLESTTSGNAEMKIYDINGRVLKAWTEKIIAGQNLISFDTKSLKAGVYFMTIGKGNSIESAKFVVMN